MTRNVSRGLLVAIAMVGYVVASHALGEQYPVGPLSMFSDGLQVSSRIVARTNDGRLCELSAFERWHCPGTLDFRAGSNPQCRIDAEHAEMDRKVEAMLRRSGGGDGAGARVTVVRHSYRVAYPSAPIDEELCELSPCTAVEIEGRCTSTR